jgi:hypothetical protein
LELKFFFGVRRGYVAPDVYFEKKCLLRLYLHPQRSHYGENLMPSEVLLAIVDRKCTPNVHFQVTFSKNKYIPLYTMLNLLLNELERTARTFMFLDFM